MRGLRGAMRILLLVFCCAASACVAYEDGEEDAWTLEDEPRGGREDPTFGPRVTGRRR